MATREEAIHMAALAGERDGFLARAKELAGEVRKTTISMHTSQKAAVGAIEAARKAIDEVSTLKGILREVDALGVLEVHNEDLAYRVAKVIGKHNETEHN